MPVQDFLSQSYHFKNKVVTKIGLSYELSTSVAGYSIILDRAMAMSLFSMCTMTNGY